MQAATANNHLTVWPEGRQHEAQFERWPLESSSMQPYDLVLRRLRSQLGGRISNSLVELKSSGAMSGPPKRAALPQKSAAEAWNSKLGSVVKSLTRLGHSPPHKGKMCAQGSAWLLV